MEDNQELSDNLKVPVTATLPTELKKTLVKDAKKNGLSISSMLTLIVDRYYHPDTALISK